LSGRKDGGRRTLESAEWTLLAEAAMRDGDWLDWSVGEIMAEWPQTIRVFIDRGLHCVGCPISPFHSLAEAAAEHGQGFEGLEAAVAAVIASARADRAAAHRQ
jgi:hybrid cluster-associated redox disulfide protein